MDASRRLTNALMRTPSLPPNSNQKFRITRITIAKITMMGQEITISFPPSSRKMFLKLVTVGK